MLELAYANQEELQKKFLSIAFVDKYKYYNNSTYIGYKSDLSEDSWAELQFVSKKDGVVIGFLGASIDRTVGYVMALQAVNFCDKSIAFSRDFHKFLTDLFIKYNFRKVNFSVVIGNPIERMYDRFIKKYGGRIVGTFEGETMLWDREYYDVKYYEITKDNFMKHWKYRRFTNEETKDNNRN